MSKFSDSELSTIAFVLRTGHLGSFAASIGDALSVADKKNSQRLSEAFTGLFYDALSSYEFSRKDSRADIEGRACSHYVQK